MDWYPLFLIFSFIVLKSIGFLMIMEQPGAIKSVTGNEKKELGSFLLRYEKTFLCFDFIIKNILSLELNRREQTRLKRNQKHKARNGLCQHSLSLLKAGFHNKPIYQKSATNIFQELVLQSDNYLYSSKECFLFLNLFKFWSFQKWFYTILRLMKNKGNICDKNVYLSFVNFLTLKLTEGKACC